MFTKKTLPVLLAVFTLLGASLFGTAAAGAQESSETCASQTLSTEGAGTAFISYQSFLLGELVPVDGCALTGTATVTEVNNCGDFSEESRDRAIKTDNQIRFGGATFPVETTCEQEFHVPVVGHSVVEINVSESFSSSITVQMAWDHLPAVEEPAVQEEINISAHNLIGCEGDIVSSSVRLQDALSGDVQITAISEEDGFNTVIPAGQTEAALEGVNIETFVVWTFGELSGEIFEFTNTTVDCNPATDTPIPEEIVEVVAEEEAPVEETPEEEVVAEEEAPIEEPAPEEAAVTEEVIQEASSDNDATNEEEEEDADQTVAASEGPAGPELALTGVESSGLALTGLIMLILGQGSSLFSRRKAATA